MALTSSKQCETMAIMDKSKNGSFPNYDNISNTDERNVCEQDLHQNNDEKNQKHFKFSKMSQNKKYILILSTITNFLAASAVSIIGPFYTVEARAKGMDLTMVGLVFSMYQLTVFLISPIIGTFMTRIGVKFVYLSGVFVGGCCAILFGFLDKGPGGVLFLVMSLVVRSVEAFGFAGFNTASMTIVTNEFPDHVGSVLAIQKAGVGLGHMVGPIIAGFLYQLGGFGLPFYFVGILTLVSDIAIYKYLPDQKVDNKETLKTDSIVHLLRSLLVVYAIIIVFLTAGGVNFYIATFAEHAKSFNFSGASMGGLYAIPASAFMMTTMVTGYLSDMKGKQEILIVLGNLLCFLFWMINAPSPFLPFIHLNVLVMCLSNIVFGVGYGCLMVPAMSCMVKGALELQYEPNQHTLALVSGLFNSAFALGAFTWPVSVSALVEKLGFSIGYTIIGFVYLFMFFMSVAFFLLRLKLRQNKEGQ